VERCGLNASGSGQGPVARFCERGNELSVPQKERNFLTSLIITSFSIMTVLHGLN